MRRVQYKITAPGFEDGMICTYEDGALTEIHGINKMASLWENICINAPIPLTESEIPNKKAHFEGLVIISEIALSATDAKIAAFCAAYQRHTGVKYRFFKGEAKSIASLQLTPELINLYFNNSEWWGKQPKSIRNLASNYNALLQLQKGHLKADKSGFPDSYNMAYEKTLHGKELSAYWAHLRSKGLEPKRNSLGVVVDWTKAAMILMLSILLLSGCMTDRKVSKYLANHAYLVPSNTDTIWSSEAIPFQDTIYLPEDTLDYSFDWTWEDKDTSWSVVPGPDTGRLSLHLTGKDTVFISNTGHQKSTRFRIITLVRPDTIIRNDTLFIDKPVVRTRQVIIKPKTFWQFTWFWILAGTIIILLIWRRKR